MTVKGKKFKFLSFVRFMPDSNWVAGENKLALRMAMI